MSTGASYPNVIAVLSKIKETKDPLKNAEGNLVIDNTEKAEAFFYFSLHKKGQVSGDECSWQQS